MDAQAEDKLIGDERTQPHRNAKRQQARLAADGTRTKLRWLGLLLVACSLLLWHPFHRQSASNEAIVTVVSSGVYMPGALVLAWSLRTFSRGRDLIALVPEDRLSENHIDMLARAGWRINVVPSIPLPQTRKINIRFQDMLVKLYAFNMLQYRQVAIIDADAYVVRSIEEPFQLLSVSKAPFAGCPVPGKSKSVTADEYAGHFNGGFVALKPNSDIYNELVALSTNASYYDISMAEQALLNKYFGGDWLGLTAHYNLVYKYHSRDTYWKKHRPDAAVIHWAGDDKPWHDCEQNELICSQGLPEESVLWREVFKEMYAALAFQKSDFDGEEEVKHFSLARLLS